MGKNYQRELQSIPETIAWAERQDVSYLRYTLSSELGSHNLVAIGSGGSLAAASFASLLHESSNGRLARTATPLEAIARPPLRDTAALLLSARGANVDIRRIAESLPDLGYEAVSCISTREGSPLGRILLAYGATVHEFEVPSGRDGFLATNSLMATFVLLYRASSLLVPQEGTEQSSLASRIPLFDGPQSVLEKHTIVVLANGWAVPAAIDLESRLFEAGLANASVTDPRNFAHGRHHWLAVHPGDTSVISLETAATVTESGRVLRLLPKGTEVMRIVASEDGPEASIELLRATMQLVGNAASLRGVDPGKPHIPSFGRRLFHAGVHRPLRPAEPPAIARKRRALLLRSRVGSKVVWDSYREFLCRLNQTKYGGLVVDFDGTIIDSNLREQRIDRSVYEQLNRLLSEGLRLGIASGRGKSAYQRLREDISPKFWSKVIVGLYNGGTIVNLAEYPSDEITESSALVKAAGLRTSQLEGLLGFSTVVRPFQVSLRLAAGSRLTDVFAIVREQLADLEGLMVVQSSHSVDIFPSSVSKTRVVGELKSGNSAEILCIGDQGHFGGNDFDLLNCGVALSVDRVSSSLKTCWNLGPSGFSGPALTGEYLRCLERVQGAFEFNLNNSDVLATLSEQDRGRRTR